LWITGFSETVIGVTRDATTRQRLVEQHVPLALAIARRHAGRGEAVEDLGQIACIALLHAVDRFDPDRGVPLEAYAAMTIDGELRCHLRDTVRPVRVPRRFSREALPPVELTEDVVLVAPGDPLAAADARADLHMAARRLDERERLALALRYLADLPRAEVARRLGLSEVQTSRVVHGALHKCCQALAERPRTA
jgi:RNA polymerase sigma factor (sigma-70 family)